MMIIILRLMVIQILLYRKYTTTFKHVIGIFDVEDGNNDIATIEEKILMLRIRINLLSYLLKRQLVTEHH